MNEREQGIQGIFQLSPIALDQLRIEKGKEVVAKKEKFNKSGASVNPWNAQKNEDIFGSVKMQAIAACLYMFMMYVKKGRPSLDSVESRAQFWKKYYNTSSDPNGTPEKYIEKVNLMLYNKK
jgi:hypothetical protein